MGLLHKFSALINQEISFDNEPKRRFILLRCLYMTTFCYFLTHLMIYIYFKKSVSLPGLFFLTAALLGFWMTYRTRFKQNLIIYAVILFIWILCFVYLYGWNCGGQHFILCLMVLLYFSIYDAIILKIKLTAALFLVRFGIYFYCLRYDPAVPMSNSFEAVLQAQNSLFLFLTLGIICGFFSSNIQSAEQKLVQYNEQLQLKASIDPLTEIWNRSKLLEYMKEDLNHTTKKLPFTLALGDIDHFKRINDHWGHNCGDAVLVWLTRLFNEVLDGRGLMCRWGGEEFLFYFREMNGDEVCQIITEIYSKLNSSFLEWEGQKIKVTMTFGVEENDYSSPLTTLISRADAKLYLGKEHGRNQIVF